MNKENLITVMKKKLISMTKIKKLIKMILFKLFNLILKKILEWILTGMMPIMKLIICKLWIDNSNLLLKLNKKYLETVRL